MKVLSWRALVLCAAAAALSGCGKTLDWRNAEVSQGVVYERGANKPFSGKLTNIPEAKLLLNRSWGFAMRPVVHTPDWADKVRTGNALCDAKLDDGRPDGEVVCVTAESRQPLYKVNFKDGAFDGKFVLYDGTSEMNVVVSASFKNGEIDGTHKFFSPKNQQLLFQAEWDHGKANGEEARFDEQTGKKTYSRTWKQDKAEGEIYAWAPDGKTVLLHASARDGKQVGLEETFYPNGRKKQETAYEDGMRHGPSKQWDETGRLTSHVIYERDVQTQRVPLPDDLPLQVAPNVDACVDKWTAAFRKEAGADALVRNDQIGEWQQWCRAGKQPS